MKFSTLAKWFCAVAEAWGRGEVDWAYPGGVSLAVSIWNELGDAGFVAWAQMNGISLKRRKS